MTFSYRFVHFKKKVPAVSLFFCDFQFILVIVNQLMRCIRQTILKKIDNISFK